MISCSFFQGAGAVYTTLAAGPNFGIHFILLRTIATLRFEWINKAARLLRPRGAPTLRLVENEATRALIRVVERALDHAA